ncbi:MAG: sugar transferase [Anaerolineae bacterium]|nr:sugar transferase [Anaerolineae bacterium]
MIDNTGLESGYLTPKPGSMIESIRRNSNTKLRAVRIGLVIADALMIALSFWIAYKVRFDAPTSIFFDSTGAPESPFYSTTVFIMIPLWLLLFMVFRLYDPSTLFGGYQEYTNGFNACTIGIMLLIVASYLDPTLLIARGWILVTWASVTFLIFLERFTARRVIYMLRSRGHFMAPAYIVGANSEGIAIAEQLITSPMAGVNIIGFLDDNLPPGEEILPGVVVHGSTSRADYLVRRFGIERLIVATSGVQRDKMLELFRRYVNSAYVSVWLSSGLYEILTTGVQVQDVGSVPMVSVNRVRLTGPNTILKMTLDYIGATLGLLALSPIFLFIAITMKLTDPGPIIYRRRVVGVGGKVFNAFKFRTMVVNSQEVLDELLARDPEARTEWEQFYKLKKDPRITWIGNFLRKTSIDELPQLLNVLRGEMSIVGPRMITLDEVERYGKWGLNLHTVKPGITGLWQVAGRSELTYEERVRLDMRYIRNYSIWLDLQIIFQTIPAVLMSKGAY